MGLLYQIIGQLFVQYYRYKNRYNKELAILLNLQATHIYFRDDLN
ncbi:MAG: hypothetical protein AB7D96_08190 [Arcobacteraceae bacterium]